MHRSAFISSLVTLVSIFAIALWSTPSAAQTSPSTDPKIRTHIFHSEPASSAPAPTAIGTGTLSNITIGPTTSIYPATFNISALAGLITNVRVTVRITHANINDVQLLLVSPAGTAVEIMHNHTQITYTTPAAASDTYVFDGRAVGGLFGLGSFGGYMRPNLSGATTTYPAPAPAPPAVPGFYSRNLSDFNGSNPTGQWQLFAHDKNPGTNNGTIERVTIEIETATCNNTFGDNGAGTPYPVNIPVSGLTTPLHNLRVTLNNISHTFPDDLRLLLVAPSGEACVLINNCGGTTPISNETITFQDGAPFLNNNSPMVSPTAARVYSPTSHGALPNFPSPAPVGPYFISFGAAFSGATLNGTWKIYAADDADNDTGCFESATLEIIEEDNKNNVLAINGYSDVRILPAGSTDGWSDFGLTPASGFVITSSPSGYFPLTLAAHPTKVRTSGLIRNKNGWLNITSDIPKSRHYLATFHISHTGQTNINDFNQIPNFRLRVQQRFAANSMLEVFHHTGDSPTQTAMDQELRPRLALANNTNSSIYNVPIAPIFTPRVTGTGEGLQYAFEAFATLPQDNGSLHVTYLTLAKQLQNARPIDTVPIKSFTPSASDAGTLKVYNSAAELQNYTLNYGAAPDDPPVLGAGTGGQYFEGPDGISLTTAGQPTNPPIRIVARNINPEAGGTAYTSRVRAEEKMLYTARFHVASNQISPFQSQIRFRMRTIKFAYSQKLEIGGAYAAGAINNALARQILPGFGSLNLDKDTPADPGVWYTLKMYSPLDGRIRPEFLASLPLTTKMPNITAQPGPGVASPSRRDIFVGVDTLDTLSTAAGFENEATSFDVDRIDLYKYQED